jgi:hypothetical protein
LQCESSQLSKVAAILYSPRQKGYPWKSGLIFLFTSFEVKMNFTKQCKYLLRFMRILFAPGLACAACALVQVAPRQFNSGSEPKLIGGRAAVEGQFPWIVLFRGICTGAKVGKNAFLLAGHCLQGFRDKAIRQQWLPGMTVSISNSAIPNNESFGKFTIEKVHINDDWFLGRSVSRDDMWLAVEAAVVHVREDSPSIPQAEISLDFASPGTAVTMAGYGCEISRGDSNGRNNRLKFHETRLTSFEFLSHPGSWVAHPQDIFNRFYITPGNDSSPNEASLCPGDSGGPLFLTGTRKVIGINVNYTFSSEWSGVAYSNLFTRLDTQAQSSLATWLKQAIEGTAPITIERP